MFVSSPSSEKQSISLTFSGSTLPAQIPAANFWSGIDTTGTGTQQPLTVASGVLNNASAPTTATNGNFGSGHGCTVTMATHLHSASATGNNVHTGAYPQAMGVGVGGSNATFATGVLGFGSTFTGTNSTVISTIISGVIAVQASSSTLAWSIGDVLTLQITEAGTVYTYTILKNGTPSAVTWTDSSVIITPGLYVSPAFMGLRSSGVWHPAQGATTFSASDN